MGIYKDLTPENWLTEDHVLVSLRAIGGQFEAQEWATRVLALELNSNAPDEVRDLFGVARGVLLLRVLLLSSVHAWC